MNTNSFRSLYSNRIWMSLIQHLCFRNIETNTNKYKHISCLLKCSKRIYGNHRFVRICVCVFRGKLSGWYASQSKTSVASDIFNSNTYVPQYVDQYCKCNSIVSKSNSPSDFWGVSVFVYLESNFRHNISDRHLPSNSCHWMQHNLYAIIFLTSLTNGWRFCQRYRLA